jgi:hypothetical protein
MNFKNVFPLNILVWNEQKNRVTSEAANCALVCRRKGVEVTKKDKKGFKQKIILFFFWSVTKLGFNLGRELTSMQVSDKSIKDTKKKKKEKKKKEKKIFPFLVLRPTGVYVFKFL